MNRKEAITLLNELGANQLVTPNFVILEQLKPNNFQLKIGGDYRSQEIRLFLNNKFIFEDNKKYLTIS